MMGYSAYEGEAETEEDGDVFWEPRDGSGFYETPEEAEAAARAEVPWLKAVSSS